MKKVFIALACLLAAGLGAAGIKAYKSNAAHSAQPSTQASFEGNTEQTEALKPEEQVYLADIDKKLKEKFGVSTKEAVFVYMGSGGGEPDYKLKKEVWEFLINDFTQCEIPDEPPETVFGNWGVEVGNKVFVESGYYHYVDDEYVYFKVFLKDNPDEFELYRVNENADLTIAERLFKSRYI